MRYGSTRRPRISRMRFTCPLIVIDAVGVRNFRTRPVFRRPEHDFTVFFGLAGINDKTVAIGDDNLIAFEKVVFSAFPEMGTD